MRLKLNRQASAIRYGERIVTEKQECLCEGVSMFKRFKRIAILSERSDGFTLVELLVVIGVIAVLIAILLPALNKVRQAGNNIVCMSNLRQIGQGVTMYQNEWRGKVSKCINANPTARPIGWIDCYGMYLGKQLQSDNSYGPALKVYQCPFDTFAINAIFGTRCSYGANKGDPPSPLPRYFNPNKLMTGSNRVSPAEGIAILDRHSGAGNGNDQGYSSENYYYQFYDNSTAYCYHPLVRRNGNYVPNPNCLYFDGHVDQGITGVMQLSVAP